LAQPFVESCVDFEVAHLSALMVRRSPYRSLLPNYIFSTGMYIHDSASQTPNHFGEGCYTQWTRGAGIWRSENLGTQGPGTWIEQHSTAIFQALATSSYNSINLV